ncbi:MAG: hypothetical protein LUC93_03190 [Planctomycetaceae bacterium]|nr:hypothetical protein [Planctomycetaceae bacterium]
MAEYAKDHKVEKGKWHVVEGRDHQHFGGIPFWSVSEIDGSKLIFITRDEQLANQVAREHNAHEGLVELVQSYRDIAFQVFFSGVNDIDPGEIICGLEWQAELGKIDAVLAQAEGRE